MKASSAGHCVSCRALVALRPDGSCPNCGLVDALRPIPARLSAKPPNLNASVVYTATKVFTFVVAPVLVCYLTYDAWGSAVPLFGYPVALLLGLLVGVLLGRGLGALFAYLPWLVAQGINAAAIAPYQALRLRRRVAPTFQDSFEKLARRRAELLEQLNQLYRTLGKVSEALGARDSRAVASKQRLATAQEALGAGIRARRDALEAIDAVWYEVEHQRFECEITAVRLLPCGTAEVAKRRLAELQQIEYRLRAISDRGQALQDPGRRTRVQQASQSAANRLREAYEHFHAFEDGRLLAQAASLLRQVQPAREHHQVVPAVVSYDAPDYEVTLMRISTAVTACVEEKVRVEAEIEAVQEVDAICELESVQNSPRRGVARH
jgi:hypothetical protein